MIVASGPPPLGAVPRSTLVGSGRSVPVGFECATIVDSEPSPVAGSEPSTFAGSGLSPLAGSGPSPPLPAALVDPTSDRVVARTVVPNEGPKVGEVRLVTRGDATVVQTLLATKVLARVVAEIRKKEERNWPPDAEGYRDMRRYLDALEAAAAGLRKQRDATGAGGDADRRLRLLIEFVASRSASGVVFAEFDAAEIDGAIQPTSRRPIETLVLGRSYVFPNMRLILADAFGVPEPEIGRLGPLGPLAAPAGSPRP